MAQNYIDTALTIVNSNADEVANQVKKVKVLQGIIKKVLTPGHDYGTIPGCGNKPTLLKPGAEKILTAFGLQSSYELVKSTENFDGNGFFAYTVKCIIYSNGNPITEGLGHANSKENKWAWKWVKAYDVPSDLSKETLQSKSDKFGNITYRIPEDCNSKANTILKMAKKRSQVDAVLSVASLSEIFTQDFDDLPQDENPSQSAVDKAKEKAKESVKYECAMCGEPINATVNEYSVKKFGKPLCMSCQKEVSKGE